MKLFNLEVLTNNYPIKNDPKPNTRLAEQARTNTEMNYDLGEPQGQDPINNGNPNFIEEVGIDNYLNMNGNTYDELKDLDKYETQIEGGNEEGNEQISQEHDLEERGKEEVEANISTTKDGNYENKEPEAFINAESGPLMNVQVKQSGNPLKSNRFTALKNPIEKKPENNSTQKNLFDEDNEDPSANAVFAQNTAKKEPLTRPATESRPQAVSSQANFPSNKSRQPALNVNPSNKTKGYNFFDSEDKNDNLFSESGNNNIFGGFTQVSKPNAKQPIAKNKEKAPARAKQGMGNIKADDLFP